MSTYDDAVNALRAALPPEPGLRDFVRFATLAPNSHKTQPWKFRLGDDTVDVIPDFSQRTPVVDPDDHHLYVTLGCAVENLVVAANASGRPADVAIRDEGADGTWIRVAFGRGATSDTALRDAIPARQSTRSVYDGRPLSGDEVRELERAAARPGVDVVFITERTDLDNALEFIVAGNNAQVDNPAFVRELKAWIRFNPSAALETGDGLFGKCTGNPSVPDWLGPIVFDLAFRKGAEEKKLGKQLRSSAGLAVFAADAEGPAGWINAGRSFERFALRATALGIRHAHVNMPVEVPSVRPAFADWLGMPGRRPDLVVRFGRAVAMPMSVRRPLDDVIVAGN
jgi:hypothetical protein